MGKREVRCQCGVLYRIPGYRIRRIPKCGSCGAPLPEPDFIKMARAVYRVPVFIWLTGAVFVGAAVWQPWRLMDPRLMPPGAAPIIAPPSTVPPNVTAHPSAPTTEQNSATLNCSPKPTPPQGMYRLYNAGPPVAQLTVRTKPGANYLVKLQDAVSGSNVISFFVYGWRDLIGDVPLGNYTLHYAAGTIWCGDNELFGPDTVVSEAGQPFQFYQHGRYIQDNTVELILPVGGNLEVHRIPRAQF
jgi:hypothetical protein